MKFPYTLSEERLSLLSPADREQYNYEHSMFYSYTDKVQSVKAYRNRYNSYLNIINEDKEYDGLSVIEKNEMAEALTKVEARMVMNEVESFIRPLIKDALTKEEYRKCIDILNEQLDNYISNAINAREDNTLNEDVPGRDMGFWIPQLGWLGKLSMGIFTTGLAGLIGLFVAGKDKAAAKALEKYMNRLVELTDSGVYKKKSFLSFFGKGKMLGDQSQACFRSAQEIAERTIAKDVMIIGKAAGLISGDGMNDVVNGQVHGGMNIFYNKIAGPLDTLIKA